MQINFYTWTINVQQVNFQRANQPQDDMEAMWMWMVNFLPSGKELGDVEKKLLSSLGDMELLLSAERQE